MVKYTELFRLLKQHGWYEIRKRGSHVIMQHKEKEKQLSVPFHGAKEVKKGMLQAILKQAGIKYKKK